MSTVRNINLLLLAAQMREDNRHWRRGQALFNALHEIDPVLADEIRGTALDPFHRDDVIPAFLDRVLTGGDTP